MPTKHLLTASVGFSALEISSGLVWAVCTYVLMYNVPQRYNPRTNSIKKTAAACIASRYDIAYCINY